MKKILLLFILVFAPYVLLGQSTITIGIGSSISVGNGSNTEAAYRDGTMLNSGYFNSRSITFDPVATAATLVTQTSFRANWNASSGASGYKIDVSTVPNFSTFVSGYQNLDVGTSTLLDVNSGLSSGTTYYYRIRAYDIDGITGYSNVIVLITAPATPVASAATNINESSFGANWGTVTGATKYFIDIATDAGFTVPVAGWTNIDMGNTATYNITTNLTANTTYYYRIRAANAYGSSSNSNTIIVLTAPTPPVASDASLWTQTAFNANWSAPAGATKYYLDVSTVNSFVSFVTGYNNLDVGNNTTYAVNTNINPGTTYYYRVRSSNGAGISTNSGTITTFTAPPTPVATAGTGMTTATFTANWGASATATEYFIDVATDNLFTTPVEDWTNVSTGVNTTILVNTHLTGGTTYYYRVRSKNANGTGVSSNIITVVTTPQAPETIAAASIAQTSFDAKWNIVPTVTKYFLDISTSDTFDSFVTGWQNVDVGNVLIKTVNTNLSAGTTYYYRVRALNASGISDNSNTTSLITIPAAPVATAATNGATLSFTANWGAVTGAASYSIIVATDLGLTTPVDGWNYVNVGNVTSCSVNTNLAAGTNYYYAVKAINISGTGDPSNTITALTGPPTPTNNGANFATASSFRANWLASAGATGYYLDVATTNTFDAGTFITGYENLDVGDVILFNVNSSLSPATRYYYRVRAYNTGGVSASSLFNTAWTTPLASSAAAASSILAQSFYANWTAVTGAAYYTIDVSTASDFSVIVGAYNLFNVGDVTTYQVTGLTANTTYYYRVRVNNTGGLSDPSNTISVLTVPVAPASDAADPITTEGFTAKWTAAVGATGYYLDVSIDNFTSCISGFNSLDVGNVTSYLVSGLTPGTTYKYRLRAYNSGGASVNSNIQTVLTGPPAPVAIAASAISGTAFTANWNAASTATSYKIDVSTNINFTAGNFVGTHEDEGVAGTSSVIDVPALTPGNTYYYRVRAVNASGTGANSNTITITIKPPAPDEQAGGSVTSNGFAAIWLASNGATGYQLDISTDINFGAGNYVPGFQNLDVGNVLTYSVNGLNAGTNYYYRIRAYNTSGTSDNSGTQTQATSGVAPRAPAASPASSIGETAFTANWVASAGATAYKLDVATNSGFTGAYVTDWENVDVAAVTKLVNTNLSAGTQYYYRVRAYNGDGTSANSTTVSLWTKPAKTTALTAPVPNITNNGFRVTWDGMTGATGYKIDVSSSSGFGAGTFIAPYENLDIGNVTTYDVIGLTADITYYCRVKAYNTAGEGTVADYVTVKTTNVAGEFYANPASVISATGFTANWTAHSTAAKYLLYVATNSAFGGVDMVAGYNGLNVALVTTYPVAGLTAGQTYYYKIEARDASDGLLATTGIVSVITIPPAPTTNAATDKLETSFTANWNAADGANGYYIDVATTDAFAGTILAAYSNKYVNSATSYSITGLTAGTEYFYRIRAKNGSGTSGNSGSTSAYTIPREPVSSAAANILTASFDAQWNAATGADTYYIDVATTSGFGGTILGGWNNVNVGNVTTKTINTGLTAGTTYYYRVRASNSGGLSANYSSSIVLTTAPAAPTAGDPDTFTQTGFKANWSASDGATKYFLDVSTVDNFASFVSGYENVDVGNVISYSVAGLSGGINYYYRIRAYNAHGTSTDSGTKTALTIPYAPVVNSATDILTTSFSANWTASTGATKYYIDVATDVNFGTILGSYTNKDAGNVTTLSITGLSANTTYFYRVRAYNGNGTSGNSGTITVTASPVAPTATAANNFGETTLNANWNASAGAGGYLLDVSAVAGFGSFIAGFNGKDVQNVTTYTVTGLAGGTNYYYRVRAYSGSRSSVVSNTITTATKPPAPVSTVASNTYYNNFDANWNSAAGATGYNLEVSTNGIFTANIAGYNPKVLGDINSHNVPGLNPATTYYYRVSATNASGTGLPSSVQTILTTPAAPTASDATAITNTQMTAHWSTVTGAAGYYLDVATTNGFGGTMKAGYPKDVSNVTSYNITDLNGSITYYYRVRAYNSSGAGPNSGIITTTTSADPSEAPVASAATLPNQTGFIANWAAAARANGYKLDVATDLLFTNILTSYNNLEMNAALTKAVTGLNPGTTYYYRSRSYNLMGTSSNSNVITIATAPPDPTANAATLPEETTFSANWTASAGATTYLLDVSIDPAFGSFVGVFNGKDVGDVTTFPITGLSGGTAYYYRVRANNTSGTSGNSGNIAVLTKPAAPVASAPTSITQTSFSANWAASTGATKYFLDVSTDPAFGTFVTGFENKDVSNVTTYAVTALTANRTYYYRVRAFNATGTSTNSGTKAIIGIPTVNAATSANESSFAANWTAVTGATKYYIDVSTANDFSSFVGAFNNADAGNVITTPVTGLTANTTYYYRVRSFNADGTSENSATITAYTAPPIPVSLEETSVTPVGFSANWNASVGAAGYYLDVATDNGFTTFLTGFQNKDVGNVLTYSITGIERGTSYYYRVRARNVNSTSSSSVIISMLAAPMAATGSNITQTSFTANWGSVGGATKYYLDASTDVGFAAGMFLPGLENKDVGNVTEFSITMLTKNTNYYYRVRSYDGVVTSGNSDIITTRTLPDAPTAQAATDITQVSFSANWIIPGGSAPGYRMDVATDIGFTSFVTGYNDIPTGNVLTYPVTGLTPGTTYYYRVRALNPGGATDNSNIITVLLPPGTPVATAAQKETTTSFKATWVSTGISVGFKMDVATDSTFLNIISSNIDTGNNLFALVGGLTSNTTYYYRVRAYNASGTSTNSNFISVTTLAEKPVLSNIEPDILNYVIKQSKINITDSLNVQSPSNTPIMFATLIVDSNYVKNEDELTFTNTRDVTGAWDAEKGILTLTGASSADGYKSLLGSVCYTNNSLIPSSLEKRITIIISNGFFESNSAARQIKIAEGNVPPVIKNVENTKLIFSKGESPLRILLSATITTEDPDNAYLQSAVIGIPSGYIKNEDFLDFTNTGSITGTFNKEIGVLTLTGKSTVASYQAAIRGVSYRNGLLANGTSSEKIIEFTINDGLASSTIVSRGLVVKAPLETPTSLRGTITSNSVELTWTDTNHGEGGYLIERSEGVNTLYAEIARTDSNAIEYVDVTIKNGKKYFYRVAAFKSILKSDYSNEISVIGVVVGISDQRGIPTNFVISQNYPNPFNPLTTIIFGLPCESRVKIEVYNAIGQRVEELLDETRAAGYYKINWNGSKFSSGVYIYRISAASIEGSKHFIDVKRMVLIK